jgi:hypothetical protein
MGRIYIQSSTLFFGAVVCIMAIVIAVLVTSKNQAPVSQQNTEREEVIVVNTESGDDRYTRAPKPERNWMTAPDMTTSTMYGLPTVPTRGLPESYQSMGVIKAEDGKILPLYGRRTTARSDRFQYYTRTDTYNPVPLPIRYQNRDCQDDVGCSELMDGERIKVASLGEEGVVSIYRFNGPTYVPTII